MESSSLSVDQKIFSASRIWLFLDYDGTIAEFALTPDHIEPDPELIQLIQNLSANPLIRVTIISGRRLEHIRKLLPVNGIWLAGTYGIEYQQPEGVEGYLLSYQEIRPIIESIKPRLEDILAGKEGFYLEDKGWALAIHARFADDHQAEEALEAARAVMESARKPDQFRILGGHKFIEIGPRAAHKGKSVEWLFQEFPFRDGLPVYLGDDDKDEEAFAVVHQHSGVAILIGPDTRQTQADARLPSPQAARAWLRTLLEKFNQRIFVTGSQTHSES